MVIGVVVTVVIPGKGQRVGGKCATRLWSSSSCSYFLFVLVPVVVGAVVSVVVAAAVVVLFAV